jgi:membrane-associated phospholipid phosphatase
MVSEIILGAPYIFLWLKSPDLKRQYLLASGIFGACLAVIMARILAIALPFDVRPRFDASSGFHPLSISFDPDLMNWSSFPSDHAALASGITLGLFAISPLISLFFFAVSFIIISLSRVYEGIHYPLDILAGAALGVIATFLSLKIVPRILSFLHSRISKNLESFFYCIVWVVFVETIGMFSGFRQLGKLCILLLQTRV